jgi:uncharacterized protein involved in tolerance to divalent cations
MNHMIKCMQGIYASSFQIWTQTVKKRNNYKTQTQKIAAQQATLHTLHILSFHNLHIPSIIRYHQERIRKRK